MRFVLCSSRLAFALVVASGTLAAPVLAEQQGNRSVSNETAAPMKAHGAPGTEKQVETTRAKQVKEKIVGRWEMIGQHDTLEFRADGTFNGKSEHAELTGRYRITPEGDLSIAWGLPIQPYKGKAKDGGAVDQPTPAAERPLELRRKVRFEKGELVLTDPESGESFRYRRLP